MIEQQATQVVVVGAGMSGLRAAQQLDQNGIDVVVVEARDRIGGRAHDVDGPDGTTIEVGGQWVGPTQHAMHRVLDEFDLATFPTFDSGASVSQFGSAAARRFDDASFGMNELTLIDVGIAQLRLNRLISTIDPTAPWQHRHARRLDGQTIETWIGRNCRSQRARDFWRLITRAVFSCEADEISLLHWLFYFQSGGGLDAVLDTTGGAQQDRIIGGPTTVARRLAAGLDVRLDSPVQRIVSDDNGVVVHTNGSALRADRLIVAIPPALYARIEFNPSLPGPKGQLSQHMPMGAVIKTNTYYDTPWWRDTGLNGQALSPERAVGVVFDNSPNDGSCGILLGFFEGEHARQASSLGPDERRAIVEDDLVAYFGQQARESTGYVENDWCSEPWSGGAYAGRFTTGGWTTFGPTLRQPHGRIHFAGTETATVWNGYLDGAISAGERAATEVAATINQNRHPTHRSALMTDTDHNPHAIIHTRSALTGLTDKGVWFEELTRRRDLSTAIYQLPPGAHDPQTPHGEQEIYYVLSGHGQIAISGTEHHVATGDLIDVPAGADHRFHSIIDTLQLLAVFAPAFGTIQS